MLRTDTDKALDAIWLLYALQKAAVSGRTKLQKSLFLVELRLQEQDLPAPHFRFFRYNNGPSSRQVWDTLDDLRNKGFVHKASYQPTARGSFLVDLALPQFKAHGRTADALALADVVLEFCKGRNGEWLMNYVYKREVVPAEIAGSGEKMEIREVPMFWDIIQPARDNAGLDSNFLRVLAQYESVSDEEVQKEIARLDEIEREAIQKLSLALDADPQE